MIKAFDDYSGIRVVPGSPGSIGATSIVPSPLLWILVGRRIVVAAENAGVAEGCHRKSNDQSDRTDRPDYCDQRVGLGNGRHQRDAGNS